MEEDEEQQIIFNFGNYMIDNKGKKIIYGSFWTSKQRQANSIHEISYRACFKPQLPNFFLKKYSKLRSVVLDPFAGRGTTAIESALLGRIPISNDINPISKILTEPRLQPPRYDELVERLNSISFDENLEADIDLSMFYHKKTEAEIVSLKNYLKARKEEGKEDYIDKWIRMVATNRLTGHSKNFFSVYSLPPNQSATQEEQIRINQKLQQIPQYRDVKKIVLKKSKSLLKDITPSIRENLFEIAKYAVFLEEDSRNLKGIESNYVDLTITSPPFINLVNYVKDNWLRLWFNGYDYTSLKNKVTILHKLADWALFIRDTLRELYRVTKPMGYVAFEVGETKNADLSEIVYEKGLEVGFQHIATFINLQKFTKTSNIWGVDNNKKGTNTNRIVLFQKTGDKLIDEEYVKELEETIAKMIKPLKGIPLKIVIKSLSGFEVLDFDKNDPRDKELLNCLVRALKNAVEAINKEGIDSARPNEAGNAVESFVKEALTAIGCEAETPNTLAGKKKSSGYPDIIFKDQYGRYNYLECKTFNQKDLNSSLRTFYLSPSSNFKITTNAHHLLASFEMDKKNGRFYAKGFKLLTLEKIKVDVKNEFNANNKELYREDNILFEYYI